MSRKKRQNTHTIPPIVLDGDDVQQQAVWHYYQELSRTGRAADWIRQALISALPAAPATPSPKVIIKQFTGVLPQRPANLPTKSTPHPAEDVTYEDADE